MQISVLSDGKLEALKTSDEFNAPQIGDALDNMHVNMARGLPSMKVAPEREGETLVICAGGHSLADCFDDLKDNMSDDRKIFAVNDTHDWLVEKGIVPWGFAMMEIAPWEKEFISFPQKQTQYFLSSLSHPTAFDRLKDYDITVWHPWSGIGEETIIQETDPGAPIVHGAEAVSIRALNLGYVLGFRKFEMYGVDGSYKDGQSSHIYFDRKQPMMNVWHDGKSFRTAYYLVRQADDLRRVMENHHKEFDLKVHGDGLVRHVHESMFPEIYQH